MFEYEDYLRGVDYVFEMQADPARLALLYYTPSFLVDYFIEKYQTLSERTIEEYLVILNIQLKHFKDLKKTFLSLLIPVDELANVMTAIQAKYTSLNIKNYVASLNSLLERVLFS
ncbi:MAG: hypothetical protein ACFFCZ_15025 [Promethearchaeota archaeon]